MDLLSYIEGQRESKVAPISPSPSMDLSGIFVFYVHCLLHLGRLLILLDPAGIQDYFLFGACRCFLIWSASSGVARLSRQKKQDRTPNQIKETRLKAN